MLRRRVAEAWRSASVLVNACQGLKRHPTLPGCRLWSHRQERRLRLQLPPAGLLARQPSLVLQRFTACRRHVGCRGGNIKQKKHHGPPPMLRPRPCPALRTGGQWVWNPTAVGADGSHGAWTWQALAAPPYSAPHMPPPGKAAAGHALVHSMLAGRIRRGGGAGETVRLCAWASRHPYLLRCACCVHDMGPASWITSGAGPAAGERKAAAAGVQHACILIFSCANSQQAFSRAPNKSQDTLGMAGAAAPWLPPCPAAHPCRRLEPTLTVRPCPAARPCRRPLATSPGVSGGRREGCLCVTCGSPPQLDFEASLNAAARLVPWPAQAVT